MKNQMSTHVGSRAHWIGKRPWTILGSVLAPMTLWWIAVTSRPWVIQLQCIAPHTGCQADQLWAIDHFALGQASGIADGYSYAIQNLSVLMALTLPLLWNLGNFLIGTKRLILTDLILSGKVLLWNGFFTELSHSLSQRPRPFVYLDPLVEGLDPAHYTSFYSGHTSAVAAAHTISFLIFYQNKAPQWFLALYFGIAQTLVFSTAYFRIFAGRHFLTDVLCGTFAGSFIAWVFWQRAHPARKKLPQL